MSTNQTTNPFAEAEAWSVSLDALLPKGNHRVKIDSCEDDGTSSGGHPQIKVIMSNAQGKTTDWMVLDPTAGPRKLVGLAEAAGVARPTEDDLTGEGLRLKPSYLDRFVGKEVGVVLREEPDLKDPTKMRVRVQGYAEASRINAPASDVPSTGFEPGFSARTPDEDLPF